eukprot:4116457-Pyramimonas_sp.AAC.1
MLPSKAPSCISKVPICLASAIVSWPASVLCGAAAAAAPPDPEEALGLGSAPGPDLEPAALALGGGLPLALLASGAAWSSTEG